MWIQIKTNRKPLVIGIVHRHRVTNVNVVENFGCALQDVISTLNDKNSEFYILGDFNFNLKKISEDRPI